jgi:hypothetical protein
VTDIDTIGPFIAMRYQPARTRITNGTLEKITYEVRGPVSPWGGPYTLEPGESSDFPVPYPITLRRTVQNQQEVQTLPMGAHFVFGRVRQDADPTDVAGRPDAKTSRQ